MLIHSCMMAECLNYMPTTIQHWDAVPVTACVTMIAFIKDVQRSKILATL